MASLSAESNMRRPTPSDRTIALASSIVLSKPEELSIREYIELLRQHVAKGRRMDALSSAHRHLDRSSLWRSEYERMKDTCKAAEAKIIDLKIENDKLKQAQEKPRPVSPAKKRKKQPGEDVIPAARSPKKQKQGPSLSNSTLDAVELTSDLGVGDVGEIGHDLVRRLCEVQSQIKPFRPIDAAALAYNLIKTATSVPEMVQKMISEHNASEATDMLLFKAVLNAADRAVKLLLDGLRRLSNSHSSAEVTGHVKYAYVQMYSNLLECLDAMATLDVKRAEKEAYAATVGKKASPLKAKAKQQKQTNIKDNAALNLVTKLLCSIVDGLDPKLDVHKSLYEGFAYVILKRLGVTLYLLVFGHSRGATIEDEIRTYNEVDEIDEDDAEPNTKGQPLKSAKLQAPYLIHLLSRIMIYAPAHLDAVVLTTKGSPRKAVKGSMKGALAIDARERLQRTLIRCMFGEEGGEDDEFNDCLKMPALKGPPLPTPKVKEQEVQEWFKEEVWRLLGWEILSREIEM